MRSHAHLNIAVSILGAYPGNPPLGAWLKQYFREQKKMGSNDRRQVSHFCYSYYRLGAAFAGLSTEDKILTGIFLCSQHPNKALEELRPDWNARIGLSPQEKLDWLGATPEADKIFPFVPFLSKEIDAAAFQHSFLIQPDLFLRVRPGKKDQVMHKLREATILFEEVAPLCLALPNGSKIDGVIRLDEEAVVQDRSSQEVIGPFEKTAGENEPLSIWDCCAASGGKSLLFHDRFPNAGLTVSDIREAILANLRKRFAQAGIHRYHSFIADLSSKKFRSPGLFDLVICDAPCSGSGTWGRTPEQLRFFKSEEIDRYASLQKKIAAQAAKSVKSKGHFLYITCSVFERENEDVVSFLQERTGLQLSSMNYFKGYHRKSDTLFAALFSAL